MQHAITEVGRQPTRVQIVAQEQLARILAVGRLVDDHLVAFLAVG
jgi:hypothetical protein